MKNNTQLLDRIFALALGPFWINEQWNSMYTSPWLLALGSCSILPTLHGPIAHHLVPLDGVDLDVRVVHEAVDADAGAEETGKGEAHLKGVGRGIRQPMFLRVGASHGGSLVAMTIFDG